MEIKKKYGYKIYKIILLPKGKLKFTNNFSKITYVFFYKMCSYNKTTCMQKYLLKFYFYKLQHMYR